MSSSSGNGWTIIAACTPSKAPCSSSRTFPPPASSAGVPTSRTVSPTSSATSASARAAPTPAAQMTLCPHAWPIPGSASYSAQTATVSGPEPYSATTAVSRSPTPCLRRGGDACRGRVLLERELGVGVHGAAQRDELRPTVVDGTGDGGGGVHQRRSSVAGRHRP